MRAMTAANAVILATLMWMTTDVEILAKPEAVVSRSRTSIAVQEASKVPGPLFGASKDNQSVSRFTGSEQRRGDFSRNPNANKWRQDASETASLYDLSAKTQAVDCPCGPDCKCPDKIVCEKGDCKKNYLVFFTATWCKPCKRMYPVVDSLRQQGYIIYMLDVDKFPDAARKFEANSVPTMVVMDKGQEITRFVGVTEEDELKQYVKPRKEQDDIQPDYNFL